jgi:hypothetical protein
MTLYNGNLNYTLHDKTYLQQKAGDGITLSMNGFLLVGERGRGDFISPEGCHYKWVYINAITRARLKIATPVL